MDTTHGMVFFIYVSIIVPLLSLQPRQFGKQSKANIYENLPIKP